MAVFVRLRCLLLLLSVAEGRHNDVVIDGMIRDTRSVQRDPGVVEVEAADTVLQRVVPWQLQWREVLYRTARGYWRNTAYNVTRLNILAVLAFIFGVVFFKVCGCTSDRGWPGVVAQLMLSCCSVVVQRLLNGSAVVQLLLSCCSVVAHLLLSCCVFSGSYSLRALRGGVNSLKWHVLQPSNRSTAVTSAACSPRWPSCSSPCCSPASSTSTPPRPPCSSCERCTTGVSGAAGVDAQLIAEEGTK